MQVHTTLDLTNPETPEEIKATLEFQPESCGPNETEIAILKQIEVCVAFPQHHASSGHHTPTYVSYFISLYPPSTMPLPIPR